MSQWYGTARSNYVRIKDMAALKEAIKDINITIETDPEGRVAFFGNDSDSGGWPTVEIDDGYEPFDPAVSICPHMQEGEVLVCMQAGAEKQRYVTGHALAYSHLGQVCGVNLDDIYQKAADQFKVRVLDITAAEY